MKRLSLSFLRVFIVMALTSAAFIACSPEEDITGNQGNETDTVTPEVENTPCIKPTYIGNLTELPAEMQSVIRQRFTNQCAMEEAEVVILGASEASQERIDTLLKQNRVVIVEGSTNYITLNSEDDDLPILLTGYIDAYTSTDSKYVMYAEANADSETYTSDYCNNRVESLVDWVNDEKDIMDSGKGGDINDSYENMKVSLDAEGQRLTYNYPFSLTSTVDHSPIYGDFTLEGNASIDVKYKIYPAYMSSCNGPSAQGDYYIVMCDVTPHNGQMWRPYYASPLWSRINVYGYWFDALVIATYITDANDKQIEGIEYYKAPIPENHNSSKSYTNGYEFSMTGGLTGGYQNNSNTLTGNFSIGAKWSSSVNYSLETINFQLDSSSPSSVRYNYWTENVELRDDWKNMNAAFPIPCHSEFTGHQLWVWHMPNTKDNDTTSKFKLHTKAVIRYASWYHWRGSISYDSNKATHDIEIKEKDWVLEQPDRTPYGLISLKNASTYEMANIKIYLSGHEGDDKYMVEIPSSFSKEQKAKQALKEGTYTIIFDLIDGTTMVKQDRRIIRNVKVTQGKTLDDATTPVSTVNSEEYEGK